MYFKINKNSFSKIIILSIFSLQSCCLFVNKDKLHFSPESTFNAVKGDYFREEIKLSGAHVSNLFVKGQEPPYEDALLDNGLTVSTNNPESNFSIEIFGVPNRIGKVTFTVQGGVSGTQCPGYEFEKTFSIITLDVNQGQNSSAITSTDTKITTTCL